MCVCARWQAGHVTAVLPWLVAEEDARPAIEGFLLLGSPEVGEKLQACGHSTNGTALCWFGVRGRGREGAWQRLGRWGTQLTGWAGAGAGVQWLRQYADGTEVRIDGE